MLSAYMDQTGSLLHNEQFAPLYGSIPVEKAPNLHADSCQAEMRKDRLLRCSLFRSLPLLVFADVSSEP